MWLLGERDEFLIVTGDFGEAALAPVEPLRAALHLDFGCWNLASHATG